MVQPAELRCREQPRLEAEQMIEAAEVVRRRGPGGFAGLDRESADALGALLETLAEDWRERPTSPRVWEHAARAAERLVHDPIREPAPQFPGPLPAGYESPVKRRNVTDHPL
ncbi:hypothetical protein [Actinomycetospora straminea]|uniref:Uncharacterized protein n=1 Tax=Actinomycetospora straminea TaxID=663607 RepID=A0ABP9EIC7_9PSEU|nr:hypothetical protein [Actinomycetospora straminea]MDD7933716.1 hypothetical protein [Actinomycetospora straminea]